MRWQRATGRAFTTAVAVAAGALVWSGAAASPPSTGPAPSASVEARLLAQQGLAIGLASNVLQSQVTVLIDTEEGGTACSSLTSGVGSSKLLHKATVGVITTVSVDVYYDTGCSHPYIEAAAKVNEGTTNYDITETATYIGPSGTVLGALVLSESADTAGSVVDLHGIGTFSPKNGAPPVKLGLTCLVPNATGTPPPFPCSGGIAQSFPKLGVAVASVTPLTLTLRADGASQFAVHFAGTRSTLEMAKQGTLSITTPTPSKLAIAGGGSVIGSDTTTGQAGEFALFPPTPTGWTVTDPTHKTIFSIRVLSNASRELSGSVATTAGVSLARFTIDRSGTGTLTYAGGLKVPVTGWLLAG